MINISGICFTTVNVFLEFWIFPHHCSTLNHQQMVRLNMFSIICEERHTACLQMFEINTFDVFFVMKTCLFLVCQHNTFNNTVHTLILFIVMSEQCVFLICFGEWEANRDVVGGQKELCLTNHPLLTIQNMFDLVRQQFHDSVQLAARCSS